MFYYEAPAISPRPIVGAWGYDGTAWRQVVGVWGVDEYLQWRGTAANIGTVTSTITAIDPVSARVAWDVIGATQVAVYVNGVLVHTRTYSQVVTAPVPASGSHTQGGLVPGSQVSAYIVASFQSSSLQQPVPVYTTLPLLPAPTSFVASNLTSSSFDLSWGAVNGSNSYRVYNGDTAALLLDTKNTYYTRTGLAQNTSYKHYVRARYSDTNLSPPTPTLVTKTQANFPPGAYVFAPGLADTWQATKQTWRGTADATVYHGNGQKWFGNSIGDQTAYFFNYRRNGYSIPAFFDHATVRVSKFEVYAQRKNTAHGIASAQACRWWMHRHGVHPTGAPTLVGPAYNNGSLNRGDSTWIPLPIEWATYLIAGTINAIAWGSTPYYSDGARYMEGPGVGGGSPMCQLRFTVV